MPNTEPEPTTATKTPVTNDSWYEQTDGTYGFYVGAAGRGGPRLVRQAATAEECVDRDERGQLISVGWPAKSAFGVYDSEGNWTQTREVQS